ncbi:hypothetical protein DZC30_18615 [Comamonas testosteroni]|uniref:Uncharacterized protein n=1 Tax=Comamonas testosteroni TaxID=285 RepID=A0A373FAX9_COMTE|nr:hypothetical protein [Comamonas testosteroni]RGE41323.1 hypothetical protein DZC30_18615 [Comamonas testosteroni]
MTLLEIHHPELTPVVTRIDQLSAIADERKRLASDEFVGLYGGAGIAFLTREEQNELHELKLQLPTYAQLRSEAKARLMQRVSSSRRGMKTTAAG